MKINLLTQRRGGHGGKISKNNSVTPCRCVNYLFLISIISVLLLNYSCNKEKKISFTDELTVVNIDTPAVQEFVIDTSVLRPITADTLQVINYQRENWRDARYEVFTWDIFADSSPILIFDYADYGVQDRMLKRLAFFAEKAGFRGRLAQDSEIAHLHGWNAHDYRAEDLARFFDTARKENFPLLDEEWELEKILLNEKIILMEYIRMPSPQEAVINIIPGTGAIISISRESPDYLRRRFMAHEGYHALYFVDADFRLFCRERWELFPLTAKRFLTAYFNFQQYDTNDEYLLVNEFMAHILQQPVSQAADYFGRNLPLRLMNTIYAQELPYKDEDTDSWHELAEIFTLEAQVLSDYAERRWGFAAGRVWRR